MASVHYARIKRKTSSHVNRLFLITWLMCCFSLVYIAYTGVFDGRLWKNNQAFRKDPTALTIRCNRGRLGNQMSSYAALYGLARLNSRSGFVQQCTMDHLEPYFHLSLPVIDDIVDSQFKPFHIGDILKPDDSKIPLSKNIIDGNLYPNSYTFFDHVRNEIRQEFHFRKVFVDHAYNILYSAKGNRTSATYIGIHVRKGDYDRYLESRGAQVVSYAFFVKAIHYFRMKYRDAIFVAVSDDRSWCQKTLGGLGVTVLQTKPSPAHDMAILAHCNHTIITYGTFGFWGAYLAGGETVYFDSTEKMGNSPVTKQKINRNYLPEWIGISKSSPGHFMSDRIHRQIEKPLNG